MTTATPGRRLSAWPSWGLTLVLCTLHSVAIWTAMGGRAGLSNGWPLWRDDHPLYFHSALVTRHFLKASGTTAGYDPSFMSGYAKSVVFPASSTLPELVVALFGGNRPELAYKVYVLVSAAVIPWLVALAAVLWRAPGEAAASAVTLFLLYVWTDFPINYAAFGMLPYLLSIPLGLVATAVFCRYLRKGNVRWWVASATLMVGVVLVHLTSALIVAPASAAAYLAALRDPADPERTFPTRRHLGVWMIPVLVLALNAFWWLPGIWLASTKGPSDFAFAHPEGVLNRLVEIVTTAPVIERTLIPIGLVGLVWLGRRERVAGWALGVFIASGFFWGYLAGGLRALDFLQPGRHTFAFYSGLALASGYGLAGLLARLEALSRFRLDRCTAAGLVLLAAAIFGPSLYGALRYRLAGPEPFLSSRPSPRLQWVVDRIRRHVKPGDRLLYEEGGFSLPGIPDPFQGGRFSGLLPWTTGVEVIGGPYLHASLTTNFTQFGEGKLFGKADWGRDWFVRYARLYRPSAILCWSPRAREFCHSNPDLVEVIDQVRGVLIGRVVGFGGATIEGTADVEAGPGWIKVRSISGGLDDRVVLRYHSVPCLRTDPPVRWEPVFLEGDPVPFIGLRPPPGTVTFALRLPPGRRIAPDAPEARGR